MGMILLSNDIIVDHRMISPSKVSDYDYDPRDISRRFYSTYFHTLEFRDGITNAVYIKLFFPTEICQSIAEGLMKLVEGESIANSRPIVYTIRGIFVDGAHQSSLCTLSKTRNSNNISMSILTPYNYTISLNEVDAIEMITELDDHLVINYIKKKEKDKVQEGLLS